MRQLLGWARGKSEIAASHANCSKVQDSYTLRCIPQVHGVVNETVHFVYKILLTEMNSATDNPMVFPWGAAADVHSLSQARTHFALKTSHISWIVLYCSKFHLYCHVNTLFIKMKFTH